MKTRPLFRRPRPRQRPSARRQRRPHGLGPWPSQLDRALRRELLVVRAAGRPSEHRALLTPCLAAQVAARLAAGASPRLSGCRLRGGGGDRPVAVRVAAASLRDGEMGPHWVEGGAAGVPRMHAFGRGGGAPESPPFVAARTRSSRRSRGGARVRGRRAGTPRPKRRTPRAHSAAPRGNRAPRPARGRRRRRSIPTRRATPPDR